MQLYDIVYLLGNAFMAFTIFKFMHVFYSECRVNDWIEAASYFAYFGLITVIHSLMPIPLLVLGSNLLLTFVCSQLYIGSIKKAISATLTICLSLTCIETLVVFLCSLKEINPLIPFEYRSILGRITIGILFYIFVLAIKGFKNIKKQHSLPAAYWASLIVIPTSSLCMLISVFSANQTSNSLVLICIVGAILINILTFYLYDKVSKLIYKQMNDRLIAEQNDFYEKQLQMMKNSLDQIRILRHDLSNKLSPLLSLAHSGNVEKLEAGILELMHYTNNDKVLVNSGNQDIDSILNYKFEKGKEAGVQISTNISVPSTLSIESFDIAVILGNTIDNALEAVLNVSERWIHVEIHYSKGRLIIEVINSFDGIVKMKQDRLLTRKHEKENHGLGLHSVELVIAKYDGLLQTTYDDQKFKAKMLIYLP